MATIHDEKAMVLCALASRAHKKFLQCYDHGRFFECRFWFCELKRLRREIDYSSFGPCEGSLQRYLDDLIESLVDF
jgi:hypothetical protein